MERYRLRDDGNVEINNTVIEVDWYLTTVEGKERREAVWREAAADVRGILSRHFSPMAGYAIPSRTIGASKFEHEGRPIYDRWVLLYVPDMEPGAPSFPPTLLLLSLAEQSNEVTAIVQSPTSSGKVTRLFEDVALALPVDVERQHGKTKRIHTTAMLTPSSFIEVLKEMQNGHWQLMGQRDGEFKWQEMEKSHLEKLLNPETRTEEDIRRAATIAKVTGNPVIVGEQKPKFRRKEMSE